MALPEGLAGKAIAVGVAALLAGAGGVAGYLHELHMDETRRFSPWRLISRMFIACVIGVAADDLLPVDLYGRGAFIVMAGFLSLTILGIVKRRGPKILKDIIP